VSRVRAGRLFVRALEVAVFVVIIALYLIVLSRGQILHGRIV
jgi:hypothetical protein